jgi:oxygen-independent coproporphyrinogen-3 oxidase
VTTTGPTGVYVHWPYCARICPYCDFNVFKDRAGRGRPTLAAPSSPTWRRRPRSPAPRLVSVFLGGGTPSLMDPAWAGEIVAAARRLWSPAADLEVTLEANPTDAEAARFAAFAAAGVNRLSLGLQSLHDDALSLPGRNHDAATAIRATRGRRPRLPAPVGRPDLRPARPDAGGLGRGAAPRVGLGAEHCRPTS